FYLRHYIPRVFDGLKGLESLTFSPATILSTGGGLGPLLKPEFLETIDKLKQIAEYDAEAAAKSAFWSAKIEDLGIPQLFNGGGEVPLDRKSTRLNSSHVSISYAVFCLKKK